MRALSKTPGWIGNLRGARSAERTKKEAALADIDPVIIDLWPTHTGPAIAEKLGVTINTVAGRVHKLKQKGLLVARNGQPVAVRKTRRPTPETFRPKPPALVYQSTIQAASRPAPVSRVPETRGAPGVWRAPIALPWATLQSEALRFGCVVATRDDLVAYSRRRVAAGWQPRAIAQAAPR
jgi:hypothetical protein